MSAAYILDAISEKVIQDINNTNAHEYEIQDDVGLCSLMLSLNEPLFYQYCANRNLDTDNDLSLKMAIRSYIDYLHYALLDTILEDYDPEEDLS